MTSPLETHRKGMAVGGNREDDISETTTEGEVGEIYWDGPKRRREMGPRGQHQIRRGEYQISDIMRRSRLQGRLEIITRKEGGVELTGQAVDTRGRGDAPRGGGSG